jgi:hypothetical protein
MSAAIPPPLAFTAVINPDQELGNDVSDVFEKLSSLKKLIL